MPIEIMDLSLDCLNSLVTKIELLTLPADETYKLVLVNCCEMSSQLQNGLQCFDFSTRDAQSQDTFDVVCRASWAKNHNMLQQHNRAKFVDFGRIDTATIRMQDPSKTSKVFLQCNDFKVRVTGVSEINMSPCEYTQTLTLQNKC